MFEDIKKEPEDILSGVDKGVVPPPNLPIATTPPSGVPTSPKPLGEGGPQVTPLPLAGGEKPQIAAPTEVEEPKVFWKKFLIAIGVLVVIAGGIMAAYVIGKRPAAKPEASTEVGAPEAAAPTAPSKPEVVPEIPETPAVEIAPAAPVDTDGDGLTDDEETALGTNPASVDSDNDGLTDREEVKVYLTDPLNPDTDADTYPDGVEVKNGYDPKGPGKLFTVPAPQE